MSNIDVILNCNNLETTIDNLVYQTRRISPPNIGLISYDITHRPVFGFISNETKVYLSKYSEVYYRVADNAYLYAFFKIIVQKNLSEIIDIINEIPTFLDWYLGPLKEEDNRVDYLESLLNINDKTTLEELENKINSLDINMFFQSNEATSIERSIITSEILGLLGVPTYFIVGAIKYGDKEEIPHAYNVVLINDINKVLDTSYPTYYDQRKIAFMYDIASHEEEDFLTGKLVKYIPEYGIKRKPDGTKTKIITDNFRLYRAVYPTVEKERRRF